MNHHNSHISPIRTKLLAEIIIFFQKAIQLSGITRIALIGSLTTTKPNPKDIDLLVNVSDNTYLSHLARITRRLNGSVQSLNHNAEVFLADNNFKYIGRICYWKECRPGIRISCDALHCGARKYLHDDLATVTLSKNLILKPPIELWPKIINRVAVPVDVEDILLSQIK